MSDHTPQSIQPQLPFGSEYPGYIALPQRAKRLFGQTFGRLIALGPVDKTKKHHILWLCQCECGNLTTVDCAYLTSGTTRSCGCLQRENRVTANTTHNLHTHPLWGVWNAIINRCTNPNTRFYKHYGGRGITICDEWRHDFKAFYDHVTQLPHCREKGYSLDRIDNYLGYCPGNLRWATQVEQTRNTRKNHMITYNGETRCQAEWGEITGIDPRTIFARLKKGWSVEQALTQPKRKIHGR